MINFAFFPFLSHRILLFINSTFFLLLSILFIHLFTFPSFSSCIIEVFLLFIYSFHLHLPSRVFFIYLLTLPSFLVIIFHLLINFTFFLLLYHRVSIIYLPKGLQQQKTSKNRTKMGVEY